MARWAMLAVVAILALGAGIGARYVAWLPKEAPAPRAAERPESLEGQSRPPFALPDLEGRLRDVAEWDGQLLVVNFWATWCPPCLREMPAFMELQERYGKRGLQFLGVAIDDGERVAEFVRELGLNYPILVGQADAIEVSQRYGNTLGVLPYTVMVGRNGRILFSRQGELSHEETERLIQRHLSGNTE